MADDFGGLQKPLFNPEDAAQWEAYRTRAQDSTAGVNKMPYVFGGGDKGYSDLKDMSSDDIKRVFYNMPAPAGSGGGGGSDLSSLLGMLGFGGIDPSLLMAAAANAGVNIGDPTEGGVRGGLGYAGGSSGASFGGGGSLYSPTMTPTAQPVPGTFGGLGYVG